MISNKMYDRLRWLAQLALPAAAALYFALAEIWNLPKPTEVVGTITAVTVFIGAIIGLNAALYNAQKVNDATDYAFSTASLPSDEPRDLAGYNFSFAPVPEPDPERLLAMTEKTYLVLKWAVITVLPAAATLYSTLSLLWCFPFGEEVVGTVAAITAFGGVLLQVSTEQFMKQR
jgi:uncharacterized membrane protein